MSDLEQARALARAALAGLERNRRRIDDLNVYPVPDGDTGTNLTLTLRAAVEHLDQTGAEDLRTLAHELTRAALMGARGNSGVIFSQILRGFAEVIAEAGEHEEVRVDAIHRELSKYRYCTVFVVEGENLDAENLEDELERFGDSLLVVGDPSALKIHVHTDDPGKALSLGSAVGTLEGIE